MPLYKCEHCGARENTACGLYWSRHMTDLFNWTDIEDREGMALCSECAPSHFSDGVSTGLGKWHGIFPKVPFNEVAGG